ncbi:MAG: 30S ribosomal protein S15, partial [Nanoarchaeota archaeon]
MAKMHSRRRGIAGSKKPLLAPIPSWLPYKAAEIEALIAKLGKQGLGPSQIGLTLRDSYGIPDVEKITGKKLVKIMSEKGITLEFPEDLASLIKRAKLIKKHLETHKKDMHSKRGLQLTEAKIFRL